MFECGVSDEHIEVAFVFDVETRGDDAIQHGIVSIGVCVGRLDRVEILHKERFDMKPLSYRTLDSPELKEQTFDERCVREFWSKHPDILSQIQADAKDPLVQIRAFRALLDRYPEAIIVSDNVGFDCRLVNHYLSVAGLPSLQFNADSTKYRLLHDANEYARGVARLDYTVKWFSKSAIIEQYDLPVDLNVRDHLPENDAEVIYRLHIELMLKVAGQKSPVKRRKLDQ